MKIIYVAKHHSGDNNDEDAISYALELLGHEVIRIFEKSGTQAMFTDGDFLLFHKWEDFHTLSRVKIPCVFWYFDLVKSNDPLLVEKRNPLREDWMRQAIPRSLLGFCTDGDWVAEDKTGKLVHLMQGADERFIGPGRPNSVEVAPVVFTGLVRNGLSRMMHVEQLQAHLGDRFEIIGNGGHRGRRHGRDLADLFASAEIVVAPDGPNTHRYWSNRVYLTLGFAGFLLHPYCELLTRHYEPDTELVYYRSRPELLDKIDYYLSNPQERLRLRKAGYEKTLSHHLYRHRCAELIKIVEAHL